MYQESRFRSLRNLTITMTQTEFHSCPRCPLDLTAFPLEVFQTTLVSLWIIDTELEAKKTFLRLQQFVMVKWVTVWGWYSLLYLSVVAINHPQVSQQVFPPTFRSETFITGGSINFHISTVALIEKGLFIFHLNSQIDGLNIISPTIKSEIKLRHI